MTINPKYKNVRELNGLYTAMAFSFVITFAKTHAFYINSRQSSVKLTHLTNRGGLSQSTIQAVLKDLHLVVGSPSIFALPKRQWAP